jgi:diguanylate cyclase (GGDEF)-like protein
MDIALILDVHVSVKRLIEILSINEEVEFIMITKEGKYLGFLDKNSVIKIISEKRIGESKNQNPLTQLPGNNEISDFIEKSLVDTKNGYTFIYFDFNNFKSYNDKYGFKKGDDIITLFSDILKKEAKDENVFAGHVGGDDFFLGTKQKPHETFNDISDKIIAISELFRSHARKHYDQNDLEKGFILSQDRNGQPREFPILSVSSAILEILPGERNFNLENVSAVLFKLKKNSKKSKNFLSCASMMVDGEATPCCTDKEILKSDRPECSPVLP